MKKVTLFFCMLFLSQMAYSDISSALLWSFIQQSSDEEKKIEKLIDSTFKDHFFVLYEDNKKEEEKELFEELKQRMKSYGYNFEEDPQNTFKVKAGKYGMLKCYACKGLTTQNNFFCGSAE